MNRDYDFDHEGLDCYRLARKVARWAARKVFPAPRRHLRNQLLRACDSVALNIAEGRSRTGDARRNHYTIALGSAAEATAVLDLIDLEGGAEAQPDLRRVGAMLWKMSRR